MTASRNVGDLRARFQVARRPTPAATPPLEDLVTREEYFGLTTAQPIQRAVCRVCDGRPLLELAQHEHVRAALGDVEAYERAPFIPSRLNLISGIRGAKSLIAAAAAVRMSQRVNLAMLKPGEVPRVSIVSLKKDLADVIRNHLVGTVLAKPALRALLLEEPSDVVVVKHPTGRPVEIAIVAGMRAGSSLVARWSAGAIFDEAPRMVGSSEGVVNLDDMRSALAGRMLEGAMILEIGSPWAPFGPVHEMVMKHEGRPSRSVVVVRARGSWMNPYWWTPERIEQVKKDDPTAYLTDECAQFADPEEAIFPSAILEACTRQDEHEPRREGHEYVAAMDPGTRGNAWTLAISTRRDGCRVVVRLREWKGTSAKPLDPEEVLAEIAIELRAYGVDVVETDQWSTDTLRALARRYGVAVVEWPMTSTENTQAYLDGSRLAATGGWSLPRIDQARTDLLRVKKVTTQAGVVIRLPVTPDGRHCDYAPAILRAQRRFCREAITAKPLSSAELEAKRLVDEQAASLQRAKERWGASQSQPSWRRRQ